MYFDFPSFAIVDVDDPRLVLNIMLRDMERERERENGKGAERGPCAAVGPLAHGQ